MKGNKKILIVAILLFLIAISYSTYAIYKTSVEADATVTAAAWVIDFKNGDATNGTSITSSTDIQLTGADCTNTHVLQGKIAPGATCTKTITLVATGTEVDVAYSATAGSVTATKGGNSVSTSGANTFSASLSPASGTITYSANDQTATLTLEVTWAGTDDSPTDTVNNADTGLEGATITVPVTLIASQVPVPTPAP